MQLSATGTHLGFGRVLPGFTRCGLVSKRPGAGGAYLLGGYPLQKNGLGRADAERGGGLLGGAEGAGVVVGDFAEQHAGREVSPPVAGVVVVCGPEADFTGFGGVGIALGQAGLHGA